MWYFTSKQSDLSHEQYQELQKRAALVEVELFSEPFENLRLFEVEHYRPFVDYLDREGISYEMYPERPTREVLLAAMR